MDIALAAAVLAGSDRGQTALEGVRRGFERLTEAVATAEGAFRRLINGAGGVAPVDQSTTGTDLLADAVELERKRLGLISDGNAAYRAQGDLIDDVAGKQRDSADQVKDVWDGFGDKLTQTFAALFESIVKDGKLRFDGLFRMLSPLISDLLGRITGVDFSPLLGPIGQLLGGGATGGGGVTALLGQAAGPLGQLFGGSGGFGGLLGSLFGGAGGGLSSILGAGSGLLGSLLGGGGGLLGTATSAVSALIPIPGVNLIAAALPLVASLFADKDYPFAKAEIGASGGTLASDAFALDGGPADQIGKLGEAVAKTLQGVLDQLGATVGDLTNLTAVGYSSGRKAILPKGFFAGIDDNHGANFATGAVFSGIEDPEEATLRAVQSGLLRAFATGAAEGVEPRAAETMTIGLRRAVASDFTSLDDGLADIAFLRDFDRTLERLNASGDAVALQRLDLRDRGDQQGREDAERIRSFLEQASRLFAPLNGATPDVAAPDSLGGPAEPAFEYDEGLRRPIDGLATPRAITDEGSVVGYEDSLPVVTTETLGEPLIDDNEIAAERLAEARAAIDHFVQGLLGIEDAVADTKPLTGYALQLAEAEARLDGLSDALREAGYSAEEAAALIEQGKDAARDRLRDAYEDDLTRDLRGAQGLGVVDQVGDLVEAYETRRGEGVALDADVSGLDELLHRQVEGMVSGGTLSIAALEALRMEFGDNAIVVDALNQGIVAYTDAANDNVAAQLTLADVTRLATKELDAQIREQEEVARSAGAVVEAIADTRRRLALDPALSILSPQEQLEEARLRFEDLAGRSLAGDQAAQAELPEASEAYLKLARDFYASNEDYARVFRQVDAALRDTSDIADRQLQVAEAQLEELKQLRRALTGEFGDLPNPTADFGHNPTRNRLLARVTGYAGDFGNGGFAAFRTGLSPDINALVDAIASTINFADGGVMTSSGPFDLHRYARGGIAHGPQLALFGEGRMPEAFVPLPDGRTIPVTVTAPANDSAARGSDAGAARRTAGIETLVEETRRLRADIGGLRDENAALRRGLERVAAGINAGRVA
ncbi:membrane protein [alpha proteobacterium BAL199]|nr:membrane protein [alpha proteobacterium BAL199]